MSTKIGFDQFYTKERVARDCYQYLLSNLTKIGIASKKAFFIEPSAGTGSFYNIILGKNKIGLDIDPKSENIIEQDFLTWPGPRRSHQYVVTMGNPPFGHRSQLAIKFFNKASEFSDVIAFIVPAQFRKYSVHSKLEDDYRLIGEKILGADSFNKINGDDFDVNCVFQIWTRLPNKLKNRRLVSPPPTEHPEFKIYQYNNTKEAAKVFSYEFDFGVPRQGYENYDRRERDVKKMERHKQWALFKAVNQKIKKRLWSIDYGRLARTRNTVIPGFGKADVVDEYTKLYA